MKLDEVQSRVSTDIKSDAALAALGEPLLFSHFTDETVAREAIASRLRGTGACIEIGTIEVPESDTLDTSTSITQAHFDVFIGESLKVEHTPGDLTLVRKVAAAVTRRQTPPLKPARFRGYESAISEQGYVLHVLSFSTQVLIP